MPKEVVQYPATDQIHSGTELSVHWSKDAAFEHGYVQIAATRHVWGPLPEPDPDSLVSNVPHHADHSHCSECASAVERIKEREESGVTPYMVGDTTAAPPMGEFDEPATVFTAPLTRPEINKLIRVLRRARDQAYGEDA